MAGRDRREKHDPARARTFVLLLTSPKAARLTPATGLAPPASRACVLPRVTMPLDTPAADGLRVWAAGAAAAAFSSSDLLVRVLARRGAAVWRRGEGRGRRRRASDDGQQAMLGEEARAGRGGGRSSEPATLARMTPVGQQPAPRLGRGTYALHAGGGGRGEGRERARTSREGGSWTKGVLLGGGLEEGGRVESGLLFARARARREGKGRREGGGADGGNKERL